MLCSYALFWLYTWNRFLSNKNKSSRIKIIVLTYLISFFNYSVLFCVIKCTSILSQKKVCFSDLFHQHILSIKKNYENLNGNFIDSHRLNRQLDQAPTSPRHDSTHWSEWGHCSCLPLWNIPSAGKVLMQGGRFLLLSFWHHIRQTTSLIPIRGSNR